MKRGTNLRVGHDIKLPTERFGAVFEAYQSRTARGIGPSNAVVTDEEVDARISFFDLDAHQGSVRVFYGIAECL